METSETLKIVEEFAKKFGLVIGSMGFSETGELEKVYLFKTRAVKSPSNSHYPSTGAKPTQLLASYTTQYRGKHEQI